MHVIEFNGRLIGPFVHNGDAHCWAEEHLGNKSWSVRPVSDEAAEPAVSGHLNVQRSPDSRKRSRLGTVLFGVEGLVNRELSSTEKLIAEFSLKVLDGMPGSDMVFVIKRVDTEQFYGPFDSLAALGDYADRELVNTDRAFEMHPVRRPIGYLRPKTTVTTG